MWLTYILYKCNYHKFLIIIRYFPSAGNQNLNITKMLTLQIIIIVLQKLHFSHFKKKYLSNIWNLLYRYLFPSSIKQKLNIQKNLNIWMVLNLNFEAPIQVTLQAVYKHSVSFPSVGESFEAKEDAKLPTKLMGTNILT